MNMLDTLNGLSEKCDIAFMHGTRTSSSYGMPAHMPMSTLQMLKMAIVTL